MIYPAEVEKAYRLALEARANSYSPYSKFKVGASFKISGKDEYISGTNVENASFGGAICAERSAIVSAISQGERHFDFAVVVTDTDPASPPCGFCLQVMTEFCSGNFPIYLANLQGVKVKYELGKLLSTPFDHKNLLKGT
jgi:cytidine deaminase